MELDDGFSDQFPTCRDSGFGLTLSCRYRNQLAILSHENLVSAAHLNFMNMQLYVICSGFNGGKNAARFVVDRLVYEIYIDNPITLARTPDEIVKQLEIKFKNVAARYFDTQAELMSKRCLAETINTEASRNEISEIDKKIREGTTTILAIRMNNDLYVLNCGRSMALALNTKREAIRLSKSLHENDDTIEIGRLEAIGIDPEKVLNPTRAIGDFHRSYLYKEKEEFSEACEAPIISTPDIRHFVIDDNWMYLVLLSDGVVQSLKEIDVEDIPTEVLENFKEDNTPKSTAQALVDGFARKHNDAFINRSENNKLCSMSSQREEMAVIFVKLPYVNNSIYSTYDSTVYTAAESLSPKQPYVDILPSANSKNIEEMKRFLLKP